MVEKRTEITCRDDIKFGLSLFTKIYHKLLISSLHQHYSCYTEITCNKGTEMTTKWVLHVRVQSSKCLLHERPFAYIQTIDTICESVHSFNVCARDMDINIRYVSRIISRIS